MSYQTLEQCLQLFAHLFCGFIFKYLLCSSLLSGQMAQHIKVFAPKPDNLSRKREVTPTS